jgi:hypothetical protein
MLRVRPPQPTSQLPKSNLQPKNQLPKSKLQPDNLLLNSKLQWRENKPPLPQAKPPLDKHLHPNQLLANNPLLKERLQPSQLPHQRGEFQLPRERRSQLPTTLETTPTSPTKLAQPTSLTKLTPPLQRARARSQPQLAKENSFHLSKPQLREDQLHQLLKENPLLDHQLLDQLLLNQLRDKLPNQLQAKPDQLPSNPLDKLQQSNHQDQPKSRLLNQLPDQQAQNNSQIIVKWDQLLKEEIWMHQRMAEEPEELQLKEILKATKCSQTTMFHLSTTPKTDSSAVWEMTTISSSISATPSLKLTTTQCTKLTEKTTTEHQNFDKLH